MRKKRTVLSVLKELSACEKGLNWARKRRFGRDFKKLWLANPKGAAAENGDSLPDYTEERKDQRRLALWLRWLLGKIDSSYGEDGPYERACDIITIYTSKETISKDKHLLEKLRASISSKEVENLLKKKGLLYERTKHSKATSVGAH